MKRSWLLPVALPSLMSVMVFLAACQGQVAGSSSSESGLVRFTDVTEQVGLTTESNWKYGGPSVADVNNDGRYDFFLTNHDTTPIQFFMANSDNTYSAQPDVFPRADVHGLAAGDYDLDGDKDLLISLGGGNGTTPQPQRLLRNDQGVFVDVTEAAGLSKMGARGRSVRWIDLDSDGDLDFLQINAEQMQGETGPRNILFENLGNGQFQYRPSNAVFEKADAERVLVTDFNGDHVPDLIAFSPYSPVLLLQSNNDFTFTDVTAERLPPELQTMGSVMSVAEADIDNDGDMDYYFARGKTYYQIANNALSFNPQRQRLDLRDEGNKSHDGISFSAANQIELTDFYHFPRGVHKQGFPVFLGAAKRPIATPISGVRINAADAQGFPDVLDKSGWYLGALGDNQWRLEWLLTDNLAWDLRASLIGVSAIQPDWTPQNLQVADVLLSNEGDRFSDISTSLPAESNDNNWGVIPDDFNNDGRNDFFVYRFGELKERVADALLLNTGNNSFVSQLNHGATSNLGGDAHGDMGSAFDYDLDGQLDILSGDDDNGRWYLYRNNSRWPKQGEGAKHYLLAQVGYSPTGIDPLGAKLVVTTAAGKYYKTVGSGSASHSQSELSIVHFGLAQSSEVKQLQVRWRDGSTQILKNLKSDSLYKLGN